MQLPPLNRISYNASSPELGRNFDNWLDSEPGQALLAAESVDLKFEKTAINAIAQIATEVNNKTENIGARRLHTIMTTLLDEYLYEQTGKKKQNIIITKNVVKEKLADIASDQDLSRYIL